MDTFETLVRYQAYFFCIFKYLVIFGMGVILLYVCVLLPQAIAVVGCASPWLWEDVGP
jgi:hypothetical protein